MMLLALGLNVLVICTLLFVGCALVPIGAGLTALQARTWMTEHAVEMPKDGPLDALLPQTARINCAVTGSVCRSSRIPPSG